jgi:2'-hydroxyisoflavone reductase
MQRRDFLTAVGPAALGLSLLRRPPQPAGATKSLLVLGGTNFVGPAIVAEALARGHTVSLFNRGITRPELFPEIEKLRGRRSVPGSDLQASDLQALGNGRRWDAVIDVWPERSALVDETARLLRDRTDYYHYVSSIAVYDDFSAPGIAEDHAVRSGPVGSYGAEKAAGEQAVRTAFEDRHGITRCPAIVGPRDPGASYHYWLRRLATRGEVLCPGPGDDPVQTLDVRDLGQWVVDSVETTRVGTFNLTGPWPPLTMRSLLEATATAIGSEATLTWVDADFLRQDHGVLSFTEVPLWAPRDEDEGFAQIDGRRAIDAGATYRDPGETALASWRWFRSHFFKDVFFPFQGMGLAESREDEILRAWHGR